MNSAHANLEEKFMDDFDKIKLTQNGLQVTLTKNNSLSLFKLGENPAYQVKEGDTVEIPFGEKAYFMKRHGGIYFDPLPHEKFKITKRFDARSFGGELEINEFKLNFTDNNSYYLKPINTASEKSETTIIPEPRNPKFNLEREISVSEDLPNSTKRDLIGRGSSHDLKKQDSSKVPKVSHLSWIAIGVILLGAIILFSKKLRGKPVS